MINFPTMLLLTLFLCGLIVSAHATDNQDCPLLTTGPRDAVTLAGAQKAMEEFHHRTTYARREIERIEKLGSDVVQLGVFYPSWLPKPGNTESVFPGSGFDARAVADFLRDANETRIKELRCALRKYGVDVGQQEKQEKQTIFIYPFSPLVSGNGGSRK